MFFFPWSAKPVLLGFPRSPARCQTPHAGVAAVTAPSPPRRSVTLGDVLQKEPKLRDGDLSHWRRAAVARSGRVTDGARRFLARAEVLRRREEGTEQAGALGNGRWRQSEGQQGAKERQAGRPLGAALDVRQDSAAVAAVRFVAQPRARKQWFE
uniref:Uncharacterized protein n=1 Tax=Arundo donax TaxID=35708 RepID=A0A0A9GFQ7_ARUDO